MDKEVAETLAYFSHHAFELRQLGKEWGLNEEEIEECIEQAMSIDPKELPAPGKGPTSTTKLKFAARKKWPKFRIFLWIVGTLMVLVGLLVLALENEEIEHRFSQIVVEPVAYPFLRFLRLATVSLHDSMNLYDVFGEECVISNPLFIKESMLGDHACESCSGVSSVRQFTASSLEQGPLPGPALLEPVLFKDQAREVDVGTFQGILASNPFAHQPMLGITTNLPWASQIAHLLGPDVAHKLEAQPDFYFFWKSKLVWTSQIMRKVFPKPDLLGPLEVAIRKNIFITGPKADSFQLAASSIGSYSWYVQGSGTRNVTLTPVSMCRGECSSLSVLLNAGDMLSFNSDLYSAEVHPHGDDIGIAFLGHFNPDVADPIQQSSA